MVRDNDGIIEPTKVLQLGVKTKGVTTTVYNAVSQVQIYNEDLYNVIQKTYNKNLHFRPWQPSSTYQPIFLTNHVEPPREASRQWPVPGGDVFSPVLKAPQVNPSFVNNYLDPSSSQIESSPTLESLLSFATPIVSLATPVLSSSREMAHEQRVASFIRTPTIEETAMLASPVVSRPVRISSSVLVRKPTNSKYAYLYSRSRVRTRTKGPILLESTESSTSTLTDEMPFLSSSTVESYEVESTASLATSKSGRIKTTKSKIVFRPRNSNSAHLLSTLNSNVVRISSRVFRPTITLNPESSSTSSSVYDSSPEVSRSTTGGNSLEAELPNMETPVDMPHLDSIAHSDAARANKFTRVSNGVTLIISSKVATQSRPFTLEPTLVTGAAVMMQHIALSETPPHVTNGEAEVRQKLSKSSFTYDSSKTLAAPGSTAIKPATTTETVKLLKTSTLYSTLTYFATLFNGSASSITPIEDVKTEYITFPDSTVVTRTIEPTAVAHPSQISQTLQPVSIWPEVHSSQVSLAKSLHSQFFSMPSLKSSVAVKPRVTTTRSTHTTLTHFITLFSGTHTILSSIEEISPTVVTEIVGQSSTQQVPTEKVNLPHIRFTQHSIDHAKQSKNLYGALVPSVSTLFTTHTYYTTLFSGTTSIIKSREETTHSLVTLFVPSSHSVAIMPTATVDQAMPSSSIEPSLRIESSIPFSSYMPDLNDRFHLEASSVLTDLGIPSATPSLDDDSGLVFFTNFILPSSVPETENTIEQAKGPIHDASSLLNHGQLLKPNQATKLISTPPVTLVQDNVHLPPQPLPPQNNTIKPGQIIELSDLLDGANLAGNIGDAIKDIVQLLSKNQKGKPMPEEIDRTSAVQEMPPMEGATVRLDNPIYIPIQPAKSDTTLEATSSMGTPPVAYFPSPTLSFFPTDSLSSHIAVMPTFIWSGELPNESVPSLPKSSLSVLSSIAASSIPLPTLVSGLRKKDETTYLTNVEASPSTVVLTTTKVSPGSCSKNVLLTMISFTGVLYPRCTTDHYVGIRFHFCSKDTRHNDCRLKDDHQHVQQ